MHQTLLVPKSWPRMQAWGLSCRLLQPSRNHSLSQCCPRITHPPRRAIGTAGDLGVNGKPTTTDESRCSKSCTRRSRFSNNHRQPISWRIYRRGSTPGRMGVRTDICMGRSCHDSCQSLQVLSATGLCRIVEVTPTGVAIPSAGN